MQLLIAHFSQLVTECTADSRPQAWHQAPAHDTMPCSRQLCKQQLTHDLAKSTATGWTCRKPLLLSSRSGRNRHGSKDRPRTSAMAAPEQLATVAAGAAKGVTADKPANSSQSDPVVASTSPTVHTGSNVSTLYEGPAWRPLLMGFKVALAIHVRDRHADGSKLSLATCNAHLHAFTNQGSFKPSPVAVYLQCQHCTGSCSCWT